MSSQESEANCYAHGGIEQVAEVKLNGLIVLSDVAREFYGPE